MASVQAAPAMPPNLPPLPGNLTQQQVQEVYEVRIDLSPSPPDPTFASIKLTYPSTNHDPEIPTHEITECLGNGSRVS